MKLEHFHRNDDPQTIVDGLRRNGYAIVDDVADDALLDELAQQAEPWVAASAPGRDTYDGTHTRRTGALIARCPAVRPLVMHPLVLGVVGEFLGHASTFQLHLTQIITIEPGETAQGLHRDQMAFDLYPFPPEYHVQANTIWALTDFTKDNGATHIAPGTSTMSDDEATLVATAQAEMRRGSVLLYDGKVIHGGGANTSNTTRQGVNITYAVGWVRQEENQYLACPAPLARELDDDLLRVMGYQQGAFALGYVGDQIDPLASLRGTDQKVRTVNDFATDNPAYGDYR